MPAMLSLPVRLAGSRRARVLADRLTREAENGRREQTGLPGSWGTPRWPRRLLKTPAGPPSPASTGGQARPPHARTAGAPAMRPNFGAEWAGSDTRCLRFARWVTPQDARLASGCWPDSAGWALCPTGFLRKVSSMLPTSLSSFPRLPLAQARFGHIARVCRSSARWALRLARACRSHRSAQDPRSLAREHGWHAP